MNSIFKLAVLILLILGVKNCRAQIDETQPGAWYMYFFNTTLNEGPWGLQGDAQLRTWDGGGDLEQLLLRGGITYAPKDANVKFTLGYGNITSGAFGEDESTTSESRIYQEALFPTKLGGRFYLNHRFRYEQRFVEDQELRTRYRYNLFINVPLNAKTLSAKTIYLALYNEVFINGQRDIGDSRTVQIFDRNRSYAALGYVLSEGLKVQLGFMRQATDNWAKNQFQLSLHHKF